MGLQVAGRKKEGMGLVGWCLRKSKTRGRSSLGGTDGRVEQQEDRNDFRVPTYARDSFNLLTSVESGSLVDGSSAASTAAASAFEAAGGKA